jgi:hypothetical protein
VRWLRVATPWALLALLPGQAAAQFTLVGGETARLTLGGYVRSLTGVHDLGYEIPDNPVFPPTERRSGFNGQVVRLKWQLEGGTGTAGSGTTWRLDVHNRFQTRVSSTGGTNRVVGFGVSAVPDRLLDFESVIVDDPGLRVWHDLDRLSLTVHTDVADVTVGRQAITWGISGIFPVADLWAQFSPFELDTEEKPGIDAVRVLSYPAPGLELDAVVADRGSLDDLSAGIRGTYGLPSADVWAGAGKFWREVLAMGGVTLLLDVVKLRGEVVLPWDLDEGTVQEPRATLGVDWIRGTLLLTGEYHYNGIGSGADGYLSGLGDPRILRGETYYLGRHYLGGVVSWSPDRENRMSLVLNALGNIEDRSVALTPLVGYDLGQAARVSLGGLLSLGPRPSFSTAPPSFPTEFGAYGTLGFLQLSVYF